MEIRKAALEDAFGIAKVQVDSWRTTYKGIVSDAFLQQLSYEKRKSVWERAIKENIVYVAEDGGKIIGFVTGGKKRTDQYENYDGELYAIYLLQSYQKKGIGKKLIKIFATELVKNGFQSMIVRVLEQNSAKYFYESMGGKYIGRETNEIGEQRLETLVYGWKQLSKDGGY